MTIVMLGVLAAIGLPKFLNFGRDARVAAVESAKGAIVSAANIAMIKCQTVPNCYRSSRGAGLTGPNGEFNHMHNGFPTGRTRPNNYFGIKDWVQMEGFTITEPYFTQTEFSKDGAPDPANCKVTYVETQIIGVFPRVVSTIDGC